MTDRIHNGKYEAFDKTGKPLCVGNNLTGVKAAASRKQGPYGTINIYGTCEMLHISQRHGYQRWSDTPAKEQALPAAYIADCDRID